jgi:hypothetical protein
MFRKRNTAYSEQRTEAVATDPGGTDAVAYRTWYGPTRALTTLLGAAAAVALVWSASQVSGNEQNGGYWAMLGLVAAAGLVMALSQLVGGWTKFGVPRISGNVLLLAFVPTLIVGGWVLIAHQPDSGLFRNDVRGWSDDIGVLNLVMDFDTLVSALAFLVGLTFGLSLDTSGPRTQRAVDRERATAARRVDGPVAVPAAGRTRYENEPATAERHEVAQTADGDRDITPAERERAGAHRGSPTTPQPEPPPRRSDDVD